MQLQKLQRVVIDALEDVKAQDILVFNTLGSSDMFDRVVVASGTSNRQTRALAWHVAQKVKEAGGHVISVEGTDPGEWVLVDLGDIVVHVMQPAIRQYYGLEEMWGAKPVALKLQETKRSRVAQPSEPIDDEPAPAKKTAKRAVKNKTAGSTKKATMRKTAASKTPAKKSAVKKKTAKKAPAKKAAPRKASTKLPTKSPSKSPARAAAKKTTPRKAPAKKSARRRVA